MASAAAAAALSHGSPTACKSLSRRCWSAAGNRQGFRAVGRAVGGEGGQGEGLGASGWVEEVTWLGKVLL